MAAHDDVGRILKRDNLCTRPERGYAGNRACFIKRIKPVKSDVIPGSHLAERLFSFPPGHLDQPGSGGKFPEKQEELVLVGRDLLETVHCKDIGFSGNKKPEQPKLGDFIFR